MKDKTPAEHIQDLTRQKRPGQTLLTPCPRCAQKMPRGDLQTHIHREHPPEDPDPAAQQKLTINSPETDGTRGKDEMIDA